MANKNLTQKTFEFMEEPKIIGEPKTRKKMSLVKKLAITGVVVGALGAAGTGYVIHLGNQMERDMQALGEASVKAGSMMIGALYAISPVGAIDQAFGKDLEKFDKKMKDRHVYGYESEYNSTNE